MKPKKDSSKQKLRGAYYTPLAMADTMVKMCASKDSQSVLEPSCGDGVFLDSLEQLGYLEAMKAVDAVENESGEARKVQENYEDHQNVHVLNEDFFEFYPRTYTAKKQYDLILGNPPYIRYQYLSEKQRELQSDILTSHGMKANKLVNAWVAFLVACVQLLSENGKIAFVIPAEILQVAYAEDLRKFLSANLAKITIITFEQLVFPEIEQEVVVFIGEKSSEKRGIRIIEMNDLTDFQKIDLNQYGFQKIQNSKDKWTKYFTTEEERQLIHKICVDERFAKLSDYGVINVGITTGNNNYFSVSEKVCNEYDLGNATLPLIGRSSHAHGIFFTNEDWENNKDSGKKARLVNFPEIPIEDYPEKHKEYIALGEKNRENTGYKCSIRDRWYIVPSVWIPDAFFLRRNYLYPKFVLNRCNAVSTDTMHRMKFYPAVKPENILLAYYNSISFAFTEICGRSYGGGVLEILPREVGNIMIPKIDNIDKEECQLLLKKIDVIIRNEDDIEKVLDIVDEKVLVESLGIDSKWCQVCRTIWKKMQRRRLARA